MKKQVVLIILDGLRPDMVSQENTPLLFSLGKKGVVFEDHHACFPASTRVNSASIATGTVPGVHGIVDNSLFVPEIDPGKGIKTNDYKKLKHIKETVTGGLLHAPTLTQILGERGLEVAISSTCSSGACYLLNPCLYGLSVNRDFILPENRSPEIIERFGHIPPLKAPNHGQNQYVTDVLTDYILPELRPDFAVLWLTDPDKSQHTFGLGSPEAMAAIKYVDGCVGQVVNKLKEYDLYRNTDIIILSDHGHVTNNQGVNLKEELVRNGFKESLSSTDLLIIGKGIYFDPENKGIIPDVVRFLQKQEWTGILFTREEMPGTLPYSLMGHDHRRSPDILFSFAWDSRRNSFGIEGTIFGEKGDVSVHGGASPYEMKALLMGVGGSFKENVTSSVPTGNIDILPTVLDILGAQYPGNYNGRVLHEGLWDGVCQEKVDYERVSHAVRAGHHYKRRVEMAKVGNTCYLSRVYLC